MINKQNKRTEFTQSARNDLDEIWSYINLENSLAADNLIRELIQKFKMLAANPKLGRLQNEYLFDLRSFPFKNYIIFYTQIENGIEIFRIIHSSRNIEDLFDEFFENIS